MSDVPVCIDISHWQDFPDFNEVAASGVKGMIHKATEDTNYRDPNRATNCANAIANGIAISTYHWLSPDSDPEDQMKFYLDTIQPVNGERVVIDYEENGCTLNMLKDAVEALIDLDRTLGITVYSGHLLKEQLGNQYDSLLAENTDLWLAQYTSGTPSWPEETYNQWMLWQYSETGTVDGITGGYVDLNNFQGNDQEFIEWISPTGAEPPKPSPRPPRPQPPPSGGLVKIAITAPEGSRVAVTVNDKLFLRGLRKRGPDR